VEKKILNRAINKKTIYNLLLNLFNLICIIHLNE